MGLVVAVGSERLGDVTGPAVLGMHLDRREVGNVLCKQEGKVRVLLATAEDN